VNLNFYFFAFFAVFFLAAFLAGFFADFFAADFFAAIVLAPEVALAIVVSPDADSVQSAVCKLAKTQSMRKSRVALRAIFLQPRPACLTEAIEVVTRPHPHIINVVKEGIS